LFRQIITDDPGGLDIIIFRDFIEPASDLFGKDTAIQMK
jgi:hypothetical protein